MSWEPGRERVRELIDAGELAGSGLPVGARGRDWLGLADDPEGEVTVDGGDGIR
jgi:hypothetical protein